MPTVLVIDDDPMVAVGVRDAVPVWRVEQAPDGAAGLEYVRAHRSRLDVIVLDMLMPHDGILTCLQIRTEAPHLPLLPFTGAAAYAAAASELGCAPAVLKPASPSILATALHHALGFTPPPLPASPLLAYLHEAAAKSAHAVRLERQAVVRVVVLASSEMLRVGLQGSITAAGGAVRFATTSVGILRNGLAEFHTSLLVADSDMQALALDVAHSFQLPLLIVARTMPAAYRAAEAVQGVVVEPVAPRTLAEALATLHAGGEYRDTRLAALFSQTPLTATEQVVGQLVLQGVKDEEIARRLSQQPQTVRVHKSHLYAKLRVDGLDGFLGWAEAARQAQGHA